MLIPLYSLIVSRLGSFLLWLRSYVMHNGVRAFIITAQV